MPNLHFDTLGFPLSDTAGYVTDMEQATLDPLLSILHANVCALPTLLRLLLHAEHERPHR